MSRLQIDIRLQRSTFMLDVQLSLPPQGITVLLGASGSGKSSILRSIAGLERPHQGRISLGDESWLDTDVDQFIPPQLRQVGYMFQNYALFPHMTVTQNIAYGLNAADAPEVVAQWLERIRMQEFAHSYPHQLSGGQQQRVALARALAIRPRLLLLDEPFSSLDQTCRQRLREKLLALTRNLECPVIMVSHDVDEARYLADHIGVLAEGRVIRFGPAAEVFAHPQHQAAARVLGWNNMLPVNRWQGRRASGPWGELVFEREPEAPAACLGIRPEHIRIARSGQTGLAARVKRVTDLGAVKLLECELCDGQRLQLSRPWDMPVPAPGSEILLQLPEQWLEFLDAEDGSTVVAEADQDLLDGIHSGSSA